MFPLSLYLGSEKEPSPSEYNPSKADGVKYHKAPSFSMTFRHRGTSLWSNSGNYHHSISDFLQRSDRICIPWWLHVLCMCFTYTCDDNIPIVHDGLLSYMMYGSILEWVQEPDCFSNRSFEVTTGNAFKSKAWMNLMLAYRSYLVNTGNLSFSWKLKLIRCHLLQK